jgi:hypothetical protein
MILKVEAMSNVNDYSWFTGSAFSASAWHLDTQKSESRSYNDFMSWSTTFATLVGAQVFSVHHKLIPPIIARSHGG